MTRHPNPHIAFGCGEHSCIGAQLARLEARVLFEVLLRPLPRARAGRRRRPDAGHHGARRQADAGATRSGELSDASGLHTGTEAAARRDPRHARRGDDARTHRRGQRAHGGRPRGQGMRPRPRRGQPARRRLAQRVWRTGLLRRLEQFIFFEEAQRVNAPIPLVTLNTVGPTLDALRHRGAEAEVSACDPGRHRRVRDRLLRAVRGQRPGVAAHHRGARRRRLRHQRPEDVHQRCGVRRLHLARGAHRSRTSRSTRASRSSSCRRRRPGSPGSRCTPCRASPRSTRSTTTCGCPRARSSAARTRAGS